MVNGILHIGLPKTATTSIQNALYSHRDTLLSMHQTYYPSIDSNHTNALCTMFLDDPRTHISLKMMGIQSKTDAERLRSDYRNRLEQEIESAKFDTLVLSAEGLSNLPAHSLSHLGNWAAKYADNWRIIVWSRHPISYAASSMQQRLKGGSCLHELFENPPLPNFRGRISNAFSAFGRAKVHLKAFEDAAYEQGGVVAAFCRQIGLPDQTAKVIAGNALRENESMSRLAIHLLDSVNRQCPMFVDGEINPRRSLAEISIISRFKGGKFRLSSSLKSRIRDLSKNDVRWLNDTFGTSHYLDLLNDTSFSPEMADGPLSPVAIDTLAFVIWKASKIMRSARSQLPRSAQKFSG